MSKDSDSNFKFHLPIADLLDRLTVDQIKEMLLDSSKGDFAESIAAIEHDIDLLLKSGDVKCSARLLRYTVVIAQINVHIWYLKDKMAEDPASYNAYLKLAHQLNGIRNQSKNLLLEYCGDKEPSQMRTNTETDGLKGWRVSY